MVDTLLELPPRDEKELKRISSLEHRVVEVENQLLRASSEALEKRVAELETALFESKQALIESNQECVRLRQTIEHMKSAGKNVIPSKKEDIIEKRDSDDKIDDIDSLGTSDVISALNIHNSEEEIIYERILKLVENMKSECQKAINIKISPVSQLPKAPGSKLCSSKSPSPTDGLISPSKMIGRSRTPSLVGTSPTSIPCSKPGISSGSVSPPNPVSNSQIPASRMPAPTTTTSRPSLTSPNKTHLPSRPSTPSGNSTPSNPVNNLPITSLNKKQQSRPRTPSWPPSCSNIPSRPITPSGTISPPSSNVSFGFHSNLSTGIPSGHQQKTALPLHIPRVLNCRQATM